VSFTRALLGFRILSPHMRVLPWASIVAFVLTSASGVVHADFRVLEAPRPVPAPPAPPAPPATELRCTPCTGATCDAEPPTCGEGEQASVVDGCWGPCVPLTMCGRCELYMVEAPPAPIPSPSPPPTPASPEHWLDLTAFLQPGWIWRDNSGVPVSGPPQDDAFLLQRGRLGLRAQLTPSIRARIELELVPSPNLQDGFVDVLPHPAFQLRVGQFIVPFLRAFSFNEVNLGFLDRPLYTPLGQDRTVIRYLSPRDIGGMVYGALGDPSPAAHGPVFEYQVGAFVGRGPNVPVNSDEVFLWALRLNLQLLGVPHGAAAESDLARNHDPRVAVGAAGYSNCDDRGNWNRGFTVDTEFRYEGLYASAAFVWLMNGPAEDGLGFLAGGAASRQCQGSLSIPDPAAPSMTRRLSFVSRGAHAQVQYAIPELDVDLLRDMDLELMFRFDWVNPLTIASGSDPLFGAGPEDADFRPADYQTSDDGYDRMRLTFGLNYFPTGAQTLRVGLNYFHQIETERVVASSGTYAGIKNDVFWLQMTAAL
jgi:hypothetical protein